MLRLSVNINKIATLRNARGGNTPDLCKMAQDCESFGAQGITIHPRPDERHIRYSDVYDLKPLVRTEFNIEGYPSRDFIDMVCEVKPHQVTLVPDGPDVLTSNAGWNTIDNQDMLIDILKEFNNNGIRTSLFIESDEKMIESAAKTGADRIELYTESYAEGYSNNKEEAAKPFMRAAQVANESGLGVNAGHDLSLENLRYFVRHVPNLKEVSIGHALISDALYFGIDNTIKMYLREIQQA